MTGVLPTGIRKRGETYYWNKQVKGQRLYGTAATLKQAIKDRDSSQPINDTGKDIHQKETITIRQMSDTMLTYYERFTDNTYKEAVGMYRGWCSMLGDDYPISEITTQKMDDCINLMLQQYKRGTVVTKIVFMSKLLRMARDYKYLTELPIIHWPKKGQSRDRFFTEEEEKIITANMPTEETKLIVKILFDTGMRRSECVNLTRKNIDMEAGLIRLTETKGDKPRAIPMTAQVKEIMKTLLLDISPTEINKKLFANITSSGLQYQWDKMRKVCGFENDPTCVIHVCRHTCASRLIQKGVGVPIVQKWLGHNAIATTMRYVHLDDDVLFKAVEALEGVKHTETV